MRVKLGEIAVLINGDRGKNYPSQADISEQGEIPFVNAGHLNGREICFDNMSYISREKYEQLRSGKFIANDILYCLRGSLGKKALIKEDINGAIASSLVIIRPDKNRINSDYLMFALDSANIRKQLGIANNGSSQPNLSAESVRNYDIDLPDFSKQKGVAKRLLKIRNILDARECELALLDELIKARFVEMFGDPSTNPNGWMIKDFDEISDLITDGEHATPRRTESGIYLLSARNVLNHAIQVDDVDYIDDEEYSRIAKRIMPQSGDILISCSGSIGRCCVVPENFKFQMVRSVALIRFCEYVNPIFAEWLIASDELQRQIISSATQSSQANLFQGKIRKLQGFLPPRNLQDKFATFVHQVEKSKTAIQKSLDETQLLFDSLMQQYFG